MNWNKEIEKTMNHSYMVFSKETFFEEGKETDYRLQMMLQNNIVGVLPVSVQAMNGNNKLYYEISSLVSLEEEYANKEIDYKSLRELLIGCVSVYSNLEEYLLDSDQLILTPEYIFINPETRKPQFCFYPEYGKDGREAFKELVNYILEKLDHSDEETVLLGYKIYRLTRNANFTMQEIENAVLEKNQKKQGFKAEIEELQTFESMENTGETIPLTPDMWNESKINKKLSFEKVKDLKEEVKNEKPLEIIGMLIVAAVLAVLLIILFLGINSINFSSSTMLYLLGGISMCLMGIIIMAYSYTKKRKLSDI